MLTQGFRESGAGLFTVSLDGLMGLSDQWFNLCPLRFIEEGHNLLTAPAIVWSSHCETYPCRLTAEFSDRTPTF
jgi:hypothetical protein